MFAHQLLPPNTDPTPIFEMFRGNYATELLAAAVAHIRLFDLLAPGPLSFDEVKSRTSLADRPATVLLTTTRAMGLIVRPADGRFELTPIAREHLVRDSALDISDYIGLAAQSAGVLEMVERLRSNQPAGATPGGAGAAFIYRDGIESAMESEQSARRLTLALAGRAKNVAPFLAERAPLQGAKRVLDLAGGTGIYAFAMLQRYPNLRATIFDRARVLTIAREMAATYSVANRADFVEGDMFADALPSDCDVILLSNVLHDWDIPECRALIRKCAAALPSGGRLLIHDVFLNDALDGPLPIALYSAALFSLTEGRAYSAAEYRSWCGEAGLNAGEVGATLIHCGVTTAIKR